jgi:hypothetical protein
VGGPGKDGQEHQCHEGECTRAFVLHQVRRSSLFSLVWLLRLV